MPIWEDMAKGGAAGVFEGVGKLATSIREAIVGKEMTPELQVELQKKAMELELATTQAQMSMIMAEANSKDPWTSRARPSFMYVFYFILLFVGIVAPLTGVFFPAEMVTFFANIKLGFNAIPDSLYTLFGVGYTGYAVNRTVEKVKGKTN